ncbi:hypothetical protein EVAR_13127_1 [Eumeta japonica]|uniref:Uncharacterized protein n=1 Tax=Eumeta variegata TaxID=151549 RepID=A0A4C1UAL3_EUMVA|nr:hypothetical protein EVAR_13127_1 [Eumeta japonica]
MHRKSAARSGRGGAERAAGRGVRSRVHWTTPRRTRSRRMINNENTAKQTAAARGTCGGVPRQFEQRRRMLRPRARRRSPSRHHRAENRCPVRSGRSKANYRP